MRIAALGVVVSLALGAASLGCASDPPDAIPGVRLGMAPRDVRERFRPSSTDPGAWQTAVGIGDDTALEWTARDPKPSGLREARFEFHLGMLVAIRAKTAEKLSREEIATTAKTVTMKGPAPEGGVVMVLARDCPTHKDEAESYASRSR